MWLYALEYVAFMLIGYGILRLAIKAWSKADVSQKIEENEDIAEQYKVVDIHNRTYKNIKEKKNALNKFKNQQPNYPGGKNNEPTKDRHLSGSGSRLAANA